MATTKIKMPRRYGHDWWSRCGQDIGVTEPPEHWSSRLVTLTLDDAQLRDLISDAKHYTDPVMRSDFMESCPDVVRSAEYAIARLKKAGLL